MTGSAKVQLGTDNQEQRITAGSIELDNNAGTSVPANRIAFSNILPIAVPAVKACESALIPKTAAVTTKVKSYLILTVVFISSIALLAHLTDSTASPEQSNSVTATVILKAPTLFPHPTTAVDNNSINLQNGSTDNVPTKEPIRQGLSGSAGSSSSSCSTPTPTLLVLFSTLFAYASIMMLLGLGAEKCVDGVKLLFYASDDNQPKDDLQTLFGMNYKDLMTLAATNNINQLNAICNIMNGTPKDIADANSIVTAIITIDSQRQSTLGAYAWRCRLLALGFGIIIACALQINALAILNPILDSNLKSGMGSFWSMGGIVLSGFGAALGAPFWQDFMDQLTNWKQKAQLPVSPPS